VTGSATTSVDSRTTPYTPKLSLNNVLIYGCELWHFTRSDGSDPHHQGLEIELTELVHAPFAVNPNDPEVYQRKLDVYADHMQGAGSYQAEGSFEAQSGGARYITKDGCSVDVQPDRGGLSGTFSCALAAADGSSVSMAGQFSCPGNSLNDPLFVAWTPAS
jgi:hypothetical protein